MNLRATLGALVAALLLIALPTSARAHAVLLDPPPRDDQIKVFPCGGASPTPAGDPQRTVLSAGSTITVQFQETIQHPGYFRIAFSPDGSTGFDDHVLVAMIPDTEGLDYTAQVTLPSTPCDGCSLQLIQCMDGSLPPVATCNNYYSCADIILVGPGGGGTADAGLAPPPDAAPGSSDAGPPAVIGEAPGLGCSTSGRHATPPWLLALLTLGIGSGRRIRTFISGFKARCPAFGRSPKKKSH